jgi:large subunit ribosomal protein L21e
MATFHRGDYVDVKVDGSVHKGMPYKFYHGRTGRVFNVTPHAIGVLVNKQVRSRIVKKKIHARPEHITLSRCREEFLNRVKKNESNKKAKTGGALKRLPQGPTAGHFVDASKTKVVDQHPPLYKMVV